VDHGDGFGRDGRTAVEVCPCSRQQIWVDDGLQAALEHVPRGAAQVGLPVYDDGATAAHGDEVVTGDEATIRQRRGQDDFVMLVGGESGGRVGVEGAPPACDVVVGDGRRERVRRDADAVLIDEAVELGAAFGVFFKVAQ